MLHVLPACSVYADCHLLLQHRFISDVSCNDPILELLSEVKAEVVLEENELDDDANDDDFHGMLTEVEYTKNWW